ncbi:MAG: carbohydrate kinase family protein [Rhodovulum sp.]
MARLLVTGSINRDRTFRLDAALPACRLTATDMGHSLGGAAAITGMALAHLGHRVTIAAGCGQGPAGDALLAELAAGGVDVSCVARPDAPPAEPLILIEPSGERTIIHHMPGQSAMVDFAAFAAEDWDGIYAAAPAPGLARLCAQMAGRCPVLGQWYPGTPPHPAEVLVTSSAAAAGRPQRLADVPGDRLDWLVVTEGARGAHAEARDGSILRYPAAPAATVVDTTGAGDVYAAGLLHGMVAGWPMRPTLELAARLAARQVETAGPTPPETLAEILRAFSPETDPCA